MKRMIFLCCLLALGGCSKKTPPGGASSPADMPPSMAPAPVLPPQGNPADVVVEVDGAKLTRGDVDMETEYRLAAVMNQIPPEQVAAARDDQRRRVVDQFLFTTLLRNEADRQKIAITPDDEALAYKEIAAQLPPGLSVDAVMKSSPRGEEAMREDIRTNIKIKKLLEPFATNAVNVTDQEITDFIAAYKNNLMMPEIVKARHILLATAATDDDKAKADKKKKAEDLRQKIVDGADFAEIAKEHSDDPGSKTRGGDLGQFTRDRMVKPFADAAFSQDVNAIGPLVETQFGYHIIQVTEHSQAGLAPRDKVTDIVKNQKRQKVVRDLVDQLKSKANIKYGDVMPAPAANMPVVTAPFPAQ